MLNKLKTRGFLYSIGIIANRLVPERLARMRIFQVFEFAIAEDCLIGAETGDGITFRACETDQQRLMAEKLTHYRPGKLAKLHHGYLVYDGNQPVGGVWIAEDHFDEHELGIRIELAADQVWLFAAYIDKQHRRRGIYRRLVKYVLHEQAGRTVLASINPTNKASMKAHRFVIARTIGTSLAGRLGSLACCLCGGSIQTNRKVARVQRRPIELKVG